MKKKLIIISVIVVAIAIATIGGSYAWFNAADSIQNTFTIGGVKVKQIEQQRNPETGELEDFENGKILAPVINNDDAKNDPYGNFKDKIVTVENIGKDDAYVQTYVAVPAVLDNAGIVHIYDNEAVANGWKKVTDVDANTDGQQKCFENVSINYQSYNVYLYRYTKVLVKGETTEPLMDGVYIDMLAEQSKDHNFFALNGEPIYGFDKRGELYVYVCTQAMQAKNFDDYAYALETGYGTGADSLPDFTNVVP